jgi:hypothetical protein
MNLQEQVSTKASIRENKSLGERSASFLSLKEIVMSEARRRFLSSSRIDQSVMLPLQ